MAIWMDKAFRDAIHKRDNWACRVCGLPVGRGSDDAVPVLGKIKAIPGEGIYGKARLFEANHQPENLMTLCIPCQKKNTSRLAAERVHGNRKMPLDGRTYERLLNEAVRRNVDVETCLIMMMDKECLPGVSGITGAFYLKDGTIRPVGEGHASGWRLNQKPRPGHAEDHTSLPTSEAPHEPSAEAQPEVS